MSLWNEFKAFALKGNMLDLAAGVILGAAFGKVITSLVSDVLMPPLGKLTGNVDFKDIFINLSGQPYDSLAAAKAAGAPTINIGYFANTMIDFFLVAFAVFILVRYVNKMVIRIKEEESRKVPVPAPTREEALLEEIRDILQNKKS